MDGSASMIGWSASTLQSSTRNGLVSARRWQSPHIWGALSFSSSRSFSTYCGRQFWSPTELISSLKPVSPTPLRISTTNSMTSASISGDSDPMASAPIWKNWR